MKWYAIPARFDLWFVFVLAGLGWVLIGGVYLYFAEPYLVFEEWRISDEPEAVRIKVTDNWAESKSKGAPICSYVDDITDTPNAESAEGRAYLALAFPEGLTTPLETELAVKGNSFQLSGFRYEEHRKNFLTGEIHSPPANFPQRFDVIAWEVVVPYSIMVSEDGSSEPAILENQTSPVHHEIEMSDTSSAFFKFPSSPLCPSRDTLWRAISIFSGSETDE